MAHDWRNPERVQPWKPRQRFQVTSLGHEAASSYRAAVTDAQSSTDARAAMERAKQAWAEGYRVKPTDGILLEDMAEGRTSLAELQATLDACGLTLRDARGTLDRLCAAGLTQPLEVTTQA